MTARFVRRLRPAPLLVFLLLFAAIVAAWPGAADAQGGPGATPRQPDFANGERFFDQAIQYVSAGSQTQPGQPNTVIHNVTNFYADLEDVTMSVEGQRQQGFLRLWFENPSNYRFELRPQPALKDTTTKLLSGEKMWVISPAGEVKEMHKSSDGARAIAQMKKDRERLADLARFLTLQGLKGPGVRFDYEGPKKGGREFEGRWLKVNRVAQNGSVIMFFFAYEMDTNNQIQAATYPGIVTVVGDPRLKEPTEYFILKDWQIGPYFRYPRRIEAYSQATPSAELQRFLLAFPKDIRINAKMPDGLFRDPLATSR